MMVRCSQVGTIISCGSHWADNGDGAVTLGTSNYVSPVVQGNYLSNRAEYQGRISYQFTPTGYPRYTGVALYGQVFDCRGSSCFFE